MDTMTLDRTFVANTYARFPIELVRGKGSVLFDADGKRYIDLGSGIAVNSFGVADDGWQQAVTAQLAVLTHTSNLYYTAPCAQLAQALCTRTGMKKVFFSNSGAEANECAIKAARRWSYLQKGEGHANIITLQNSFHGRTLATLAASGQDKLHTDFMPFPDGFVYASATDALQVEQLAKRGDCCAVLLELVQGEGGLNVLSQDYVNQMRLIAAKYDLLVLVDEVQTGNGRTGQLYAFEHYGFTPDIFSTAKGLAGGLPLGATVFGERVQDALAPGTHGSTFGGNPVCCAGALHILSRVDDALLASVREKGAYIQQALSGAKGVKSVAGLGLMLGVEPEGDVKAVLDGCMARGVLVLSAKNKVRLLPALNIPFDLLREGIDVLKSVLEACSEP